jgi:hypothetical protein
MRRHRRGEADGTGECRKQKRRPGGGVLRQRNRAGPQARTAESGQASAAAFFLRVVFFLAGASAAGSAATGASGAAAFF